MAGLSKDEKTDPSGLMRFLDLVAEARSRGYRDTIAAARRAWTKRQGKPCPFHAPSSAPYLLQNQKADMPDTPYTPTPQEQAPCRVDFETCSEADLPALGVWCYAEHASTRVLCVSYQLPGQPVRRAVAAPGAAGPECPDDLRAWAEAGRPLEAHNAEFELAIWLAMHERAGWPVVDAGQWRDSAAHAAALAIPRNLDKGGAAMGLAVTKDNEGKALMLEMCKPKKPTKGGRYPGSDPWRHHTPENLERLGAYCDQDVAAEAALVDALRPLSPFEQEVWEATVRCNQRGVYCDREGADTLIALVEEARKELAAQVDEATGGALTFGDIRSPAKVRYWLAGLGVHLPDLTKDTVELWLADPGLPDDARTVLRARQEVGKSSVAKIAKLIESANSDGRLRGLHMYHGATTGRWSGQRFQGQNLPRVCFGPEEVDSVLADARAVVSGDAPLSAFAVRWGDPFACASRCIRGLICAAPGHDLICADYSQIESRVGFWLSDCAAGLELFRRGEDLYRATASSIYGVPIDAVTGEQRQLGKMAVLGLGFGMGKMKFYDQCQAAGLAVDAETTDRAVDVFREKFKDLKRFWYRLEDAATEAIRVPGKVTQVGKIRYRAERVQGKLWLFCKLPSGRKISYPFVELRPTVTPWGAEKDEITYMAERAPAPTAPRKWTRCKTYGGKLCENVVQATARDVLADAWVRCEASGVPVVLSVHDEIVAELPETSPVTVEAFERAMCRVPDWAAGLPVAAEGWRGKRYRK